MGYSLTTLQEKLSAMFADHQKGLAGNEAAGRRARQAQQEFKRIMSEMREESMEARKKA